MSDDLSQLATWAEPLMAKLSPADRRKLTSTIARELRRSQQRRIRRQENPDGSKFEPRKRAKPVKVKNEPRRFIYKGKERLLLSYQNQGKAFTGYDRMSGGIRTFVFDRIEKKLPPPPGAKGDGGSSLRKKKGRIKRQAMFTKMPQARRLKMASTQDLIALAFMGRNAEIARVHQTGGRDKPGPKQKAVSYARRELLGFTKADIKMIEDLLIQHLTSGS